MHNGRWLIKNPKTILVGIGWILSACAATPPKVVEPPVDADIVTMPSVGAQQSAAVSPLGVKPMTLDELAQCGNKIEGLKQSYTQLENYKNQYDKRKAVLAQQGRIIDKARSAVNIRNVKQVNHFNQRLEQYRVAVSQYNADITQFNKNIAMLKTQNNDFNVACANRAYRQSDYVRLPPALRSAIESYSQKSALPVLEEHDNTGRSSK